jgi:hypothetical protein
VEVVVDGSNGAIEGGDEGDATEGEGAVAIAVGVEVGLGRVGETGKEGEVEIGLVNTRGEEEGS